jgi:hypothetical protein
MSSQQENHTQAPTLSIADKCNVTMNGHRLDELIVEIDSLCDTVCHIVGAKVGESRIPTTSADELSRILASLDDEMEQGDKQKVVNTLHTTIELAFLHSPVYREAFEIYKLDLTGRMYGASSAYEAIHESLLSALGTKAKTEEFD